jgi:hypothetical protein
LPPPVALIWGELHPKKGRARGLRSLLRDRGFQRDLRQQVDSDALSGSGSYIVPEETRATGGLTLFASDALNPFSNSGKCQSQSCRLEYARAFARSTCLYSDTVIIRDYPTGALRHAVESRQLAKDSMVAALAVQLRVLEELAPLIDARVIRFATPFWRMCKACQSREAADVHRIASTIWDQLLETATFRGAILKEDHAALLLVSSPLFVADGAATSMPITLPVSA